MRVFATLFFLFLLSSFVHAASIGVTPSRLSFGEVNLDEKYVRDVILINPNDFGVKYQIKTPEGISVEPASGLIGPGQTRKQELTFSFDETAEENVMLIEMRRLTPKDEGALGMVPAVAVKLDYGIKGKKKAQITGAAVSEETGSNKLEIFKDVEEDKMWLIELCGVVIVVLAILGYLGYSSWKGRKKKEVQKTLTK